VRADATGRLSEVATGEGKLRVTLAGQSLVAGFTESSTVQPPGVATIAAAFEPQINGTKPPFAKPEIVVEALPFPLPLPLMHWVFP
jgi:hypothetical protein